MVVAIIKVNSIGFLSYKWSLLILKSTSAPREWGSLLFPLDSEHPVGSLLYLRQFVYSASRKVLVPTIYIGHLRWSINYRQVALLASEAEIKVPPAKWKGGWGECKVHRYLHPLTVESNRCRVVRAPLADGRWPPLDEPPADRYVSTERC